jgi:bifunctional UDP-N-acetylglucosamine pyrophosphorylase/glucosamine-1-phosphate N-acetyltransferase
MIAKKIQAIILAAGKSTRFNTGRTKLIEKICGQEMIVYPIKLFKNLAIPTTLVLGYQKEIIEDVLRTHEIDDCQIVYQDEQRGTAHAVLCSKSTWNSEYILVINGDMPLVSHSILEKLFTTHEEQKATISFVTSHSEGSLGGYGRVIQEGNNIKIVEAKEFKGDATEHCCINAGIYLINRDFLEQHIQQIQPSAIAKELYFTDLIKLASDGNHRVATISAPFDQIRGINTFKELWASEQIKKAELISMWMDNGVRFSTAHNVHIDLNISIGAGSYIGSGTHLFKGTKIGSNCTIEEFSSLENATVGDDTKILSHCIIKDSIIGSQATIGPFAHIRNQSMLADKVVVGNFVEIKHSVIGNESRMKHLAYIGDTTMGVDVNIGAGTITCNHDGTNKHKTEINDHAYIGSNNTLVAPVTIGKGAFTAAGSVITDPVPDNALGIGRARQLNKEGYALKLRKRTKPQQKNTDETPFIAAVKTNNDSSITENS